MFSHLAGRAGGQHDHGAVHADDRQPAAAVRHRRPGAGGLPGRVQVRRNIGVLPAAGNVCGESGILITHGVEPTVSLSF